MKFPSIGDIASSNVISIDINKSVNDAIEKMIHSNHRDIVVIDAENYYILAALDIIHINKQNISMDTSLIDIELVKIPVVDKDTNILNIVEYLEEKTEYMCVKNRDGTLYGVVTHTDITSNIDPEILMDNYTVDDFLKLTRRIKWIDEDTVTDEALSDMAEDLLDSVVIVKDFKPIGILTTKDVVGLIKDRVDLKLSVKEYMTSPVDCVNKSISIGKALEFVKRKHYKRLVVVDDSGVLAGIITQKELISLTYSRWSLMMRKHQEELKEINSILQTQNKEYEFMASRDSLTGLYNRYKFSQLYSSSYKTMMQRDGSMSLLILDIDNFKNVNDTYGHNCGDEVLRKLAKVLLDATRRIDVVCRWGGEEFIVLLPTVDLQNALVIADKLRVKIQESKIKEVGSVTASFGVVQIDKGLTLEEVVDRADRALYLAKESGKNCVKS